ncbi:MAG TPA: glycosyltransferase [Candidatus Eisenbacteria bacterium]
MPNPSVGAVVEIVYLQAIVFGLSWAAAFLLGHRLRRGHWLVSLAWLAALEGAALWLRSGRGAPPFPAAGLVPAAVVGIAVIALAESWNALGQAAMASAITLSGLFLAYVAHLSFGTHLGPVSLVFSLILFVLQAAALLLLVAGGYEILDVTCRVRWRRAEAVPPAPRRAPRVSIHVPAYNEPPEMVIETLDALARLDYPDYEVIVIDDNTTDERLWRPVEAHCRTLGFKFFHLENWPGFKSGALNFALGQTDPAAEIVGVVDSDYVVEPDYLSACIPWFGDPAVAFVQPPQDYRGVDPHDRFAVACYHAYLYFFKVSMVARNEHNGIIFAGTMGLIRRSVLASLGGWDEWCITEDAEISLRMLDAGHRGVFVPRTCGRGIMPLNFDGLKKQRFRWAFGGMQILRRHAGALVPWAHLTDPAHRLSPAQQWDYLMGGLQWLNDPLTLGFTLLLLLGTASFLVARSLFVQSLAPAVLMVPFLFIFVGISRFLWALRVRARCSLGQAMSAFVILLGLTWVVALACVLGLVKKQGVFLRTPKRRSGIDPWHALRIVSSETALAAACLVGAVALALGTDRGPHVWVMTGLLTWQGLIYGSAPLSSWWGLRSESRAVARRYAGASRTTGQRVSGMISDRRVAAAVVFAALLVAGLFYLGVSLAPEQERIFRTNPERTPMVPDALMTTPPETQIKAVLYLEKEAALRGNVGAAMALWDPAGTIRDENGTARDTTDDRVWSGLESLRRRYAEEFASRRYLSLSHADASMVIEQDRAVVVNDLSAEIRTAAGTQRVYLSRSDRWTFIRTPDGWRIHELVVNRAPR